MNVELIGYYNVYLVLFSLIIAVISSYTALDLTLRISSAGDKIRKYWLAGGAIAMGSGIWSMHFVSMLAFQLPITVNYDIWITILSLILAIFASGIALFIFYQESSNFLWILSSGIFMGLAIASMHYVGMMAMEMPAMMEYDLVLVVLSVAIAISASFSALWLAFQLQQHPSTHIWLQKLGSALVMGIAISGMHYTGMQATHFFPDEISQLSTNSTLDQDFLGFGIGVITLFLLTLTLLTSIFDQRLSVQLIREEVLKDSEKRFRVLIQEMQVGVLLIDTTGKIVIANQSALKLLNLTENKAIGKIFGINWQLQTEIGQIFLDTDLPVQQALQQGKAINNIVVKIPQIESNQPKWLLVNAQPQLNTENKVEAIVCTLSDITTQKQAEIALKASEEQFSLAVTGTNDGIWDWDLTTDYAYLSPRWKAMLGYEDYELENHVSTFKKCIYRPDYQLVIDKLTAYLKREIEDYAVEFRAVHKDSSIRWILTRGAGLWDENGKPYRMVGSHTDITERKQAETAIQENATRETAIAKIIRQMHQSLELEGIFQATTSELRHSINCDRVLVYRFQPDWSGELVAESVAEGWQSLIAQALTNSNLTQITVNQENCTVTQLEDTYLVEDTYLQENQGGFYRQGISYRCVSNIYEAGFNNCYIQLLEQFQAKAYLIVPLFCGQTLWGLLAMYQNSSPRQWEAKEIKIATQIGLQLGIAIQQAELLMQMRQQAIELKEAKEKADTANRSKSEFLANMSHELRTPLNAIIGFAQILKREADISPTQKDHIDIINRSGEHLLSLINEILEMSKIEAGKITLNETSFDLYNLLDSMEPMFLLKSEAKGLQLIFKINPDVPQYLKADAQKLRQVLINLLSNAIKFTEKGQITLTVSSVINEQKQSIIQNEGKRKIYFSVQDTGFGIAEAELEHLFEAFSQTESGRKSSEGTGLGLPISRKFVELMGGTMQVESKPHQGTKFTFDIAVNLGEISEVEDLSAHQAEIIALEPGQQRYKILIVEDQPINILLLKRILNDFDFELQEALNGQEAIKIWQNWQPDLILMDIRMPVMNGLTATQEIRQKEQQNLTSKPTIIIALTANSFTEKQQQLREAGCNDCITKPFLREELLQKIGHYLNLKYLYKSDEKPKIEHTDHQQYTSEINGNNDQSLILSQLEMMPKTWCDQVYNAACQGSDFLIFDLIEELPEQCSLLKNTIKDLSNNFLFAEIIELCKPD
jgi:two-component system, sensor histidine kinase and response regulator